ncbi:rod shape-determining protein [Spiroplasma ixodetis]
MKKILNRFLENIVYRLGALRGFVQEEVKMAALGSGQDIFGSAIMCIDIGGGSTDVAIISNNSILYSYTTHCAGDYLIQKVQEYIIKKHALKVGIKEAEDVIKILVHLWNIKMKNHTQFRVFHYLD